jgi:CBS-domain-containing membrane protein
MRIFDEKLKTNKVRYIFQSFLATLTMLSILLFLDILKQTAIIAALGATAFITFTAPKSYASKARPLIGGYIVGIFCGVLCNLIATSYCKIFADIRILYIVFGSLAVGISIFIMVITNTEHPPASGIALGLVINEWTFKTLIFIIVGILFLLLVKTLLKSIIIDLR